MPDLINLTPHPIRIYDASTPDKVDDVNQGLIGVIPPSGDTARIGEHDLGTVEHIPYETYTEGAFSVPVELIEYSAIYGLSGPKDGVKLIVPLVTALAAMASGDKRACERGFIDYGVSLRTAWATPAGERLITSRGLIHSRRWLWMLPAVGLSG